MATDRSIAQDIADVMLNPPGDEQDSPEMQAYAQAGRRAIAFLGVDVFIDSGTAKDHAYYLRNVLFELIGKVNSFVSRAKAAGFAPPSNPYAELAILNVGRQLFVPISASATDVSDIVFNVRKFNELIAAEEAGELSLEKSASAQLSSITFSVDGLEQAGDAASSVMSFVPDADQIKRQRALDALAALDFTKRTPRVMFTAEYAPDGITRGAIVGWRKIADASGYTVKRHDVMNNEDRVTTLSAADVAASYESVRDYVAERVLSFYGKIDPALVVAFLDRDLLPDTYYVYRVSAYQTVASDKNFIFNVARSPAVLSVGQISSIGDEINRSEGLKTLKLSVDDVSPYPAISSKIYGDRRFDWILSALNVLAAVERKETVERIRSFSYLGSSFSFISSEVTKGNFFLPKDMSEVVAKVRAAVVSFGVSQVVTEILDKTGTLFFFGDKDVSSDDRFERAGTGLESDAGLLAGILAAIDPETATLDPRSLATNIQRPVSLVGGKKAAGISAPVEVSILGESELTTDVISDDSAQFAQFVDETGLIDLTTFEGISAFMQTIRVFFDFNPNRT